MNTSNEAEKARLRIHRGRLMLQRLSVREQIFRQDYPEDNARLVWKQQMEQLCRNIGRWMMELGVSEDEVGKALGDGSGIGGW